MKIRHLQNATPKLVAAAQKKNPRAQALLYKKYAPQMLGVCRSYLKQITLAEDAMSQGFFKAFTRIQQLRSATMFEGWLRRIMVNESLNLLKQNNRLGNVRTTNETFELEVPAEALSRLAYQDLQDLIDTLPAIARAVFLMAVIEGYRHDEIALKLNISVAASKVLLFRTRKTLQQKLNVIQPQHEKKPS